MTIYAIVSNPGGKEDSAEGCGIEWMVVSASAMLQGGNPYFVPDFAEVFEARQAIALRIGKLGKGIAPRFAHRYVESIAPAAMMTAADLLESQKEKGLPWSRAVSYDRSVAIGNFTKLSLESAEKSTTRMEIAEEGEIAYRDMNLDGIMKMIPEIVSTLSRDNTLKTGDILICGISDSGPRLKPGQRLTLSYNDEVMLKFNIR